MLFKYKICKDCNNKDMSKKITTKKICIAAKNQPVNIEAIDVSPIQIMD